MENRSKRKRAELNAIARKTESLTTSNRLCCAVAREGTKESGGQKARGFFMGVEEHAARGMINRSMATSGDWTTRTSSCLLGIIFSPLFFSLNYSVYSYYAYRANKERKRNKDTNLLITMLGIARRCLREI